MRDVIADERSDKVITMVIARLNPKLELTPGISKGGAQRLGFQLLFQKRIRVSLSTSTASRKSVAKTSAQVSQLSHWDRSGPR